MGLDVYTSDDMAVCSKARVLLTGDPKAGKTTSILTSAPGPILVLNCDKPGAPMAAKRHGGKFDVLDIETAGIWREGVKFAIQAVREEKYRTVVVDTITMLINNCLALEMKRKF